MPICPCRHWLGIFLLAPFSLAKQPNFLWIVSEDNDPFLGCYGDPNAHTPNLDKMAAEGVLYLNAFANAPVCAPSRSTLKLPATSARWRAAHFRTF
jgi:Sulfatase